MKFEPASHRQSLTNLAVCAAVVAIDQATKAATASLPCGPVVCPLSNDELLLGLGGRPALAPALAGCLGLLVLIVWARLTGTGSRSRRWVMVCAGGIASNLADRVIGGGVRDFLSGPSGSVFNIADVAIAIGLVACAINALQPARTSASSTTRTGGGEPS